MDMDLVEDTHNKLLEVGLPSTIDHLKNPTAEYVVEVIKAFLTKYSIDVNLICKPTLDQKESAPYSNECALIPFMNLRVAMAEICIRTYAPQFCITDITTPGQKKTRKIFYLLTNFMLYTSSKEEHLRDRVNEIHSSARQLEEMILKKNEILSDTNDDAIHKSKQMSLKEKLEREKKEINLRIKANNKRLFEFNKIVPAINEKKEKALEIYESRKSQASQLSKEIAELQSEIVTSPEKLKERLETLEQNHKLKLEERGMMNEAVQEKTQLIERQENILNFIKKQMNELSETKELYKQLKNATGEGDNIMKQLEIQRSNFAEWEDKVAVQCDQYKNTKMHDIQAQCGERISSLRNLKKKILSDKKAMEVKLEEEKVRYNEAYLKKNDIKNLINKFDQEISEFLKKCQELYDSEISTETDMWKEFRGMI